jgi:hydroxymethylpyrimidine pyrophosphatase-like HAD family hydrolase
MEHVTGKRPPRPIRLIALDVDGTLLIPEGHVAPRTARAVREARARGIEVVICTGRPVFAGIKALATELGLSVPAIVRNGKSIQDVATGEVLLFRALAAPIVTPALDAILAAGLPPMVEEGPRHSDTLYVAEVARTDPLTQAVLGHWARSEAIAQSVRYVPADALYTVPEPTWLGAAGTRDATGRAYAAFLTLDEVRAHWSGQEEPDRTFHVTGIEPAGISKAVALQLFAAERGIALDETMAVGDYFNDVEMLREAGWGVAMGHAPDVVKAVANAIVPDNAHDGAAIAIERYALERDAPD